MTPELIVGLIASIFASSGLWSLISWAIQKKTAKKDNLTRLVLGLAHEEIVHLCMKYIRRGNITQNEYEDLVKYLYSPYKDCGGNGTAERLLNEVKTLPIVEETYGGEG